MKPGTIVHTSSQEAYHRGILLVTYTGEIAPGDRLDFQPEDEVFSRFGLCLTVGDAAQPGTDCRCNLDFNPESHTAYLNLAGLRLVEPASADTLGWPAGERHLLTYLSALAPGRRLKFTVILSLDFRPRLERHILGLRPGAECESSRPSQLGPTGRIEWWVHLVED